MQRYLAVYFNLLLALALLCHVPALFLPILEPDGALYATIAKNMVISGDWVNLYADGSDWLDKPHFPFWMAALSFKCFGISAFAYKLPAFLFWLLGLRLSWLLAKNIFGTETANWAVFIQATALHILIANFDVRAESFLTTSILGAIYYMYCYDRNRQFRHLLLSAFFTALGLMTKGIFVWMIIGSGWVVYWIITKRYKEFMRLAWWAWLVMGLVFALPEFYCLYTQFDLHPEKIIFGRQQVSGIRFFFWESQFGRFFNTGPIKGKGNPLFFVHTTAWAFLPWTPAFILALYHAAVRRNNKAMLKPERWIIYGSGLAGFLLFSFSGFQLPHYVVILLPCFAIITARVFTGREVNAHYLLFYINRFLFLATAVLSCVLVLMLELPGRFFHCLVVGMLVVMIIYYLTRTGRGAQTPVTALGWIMTVSILLFFSFYPFLFKYQSGDHLAKTANKKHNNITIGQWQTFSYSLEFAYKNKTVRIPDTDSLLVFLKRPDAALYTSKEEAEKIRSSYPNATLYLSPHYPVSRLSFSFLKESNRDATLPQRVLLVMNKSDAR
jgi:4-amino-4-deoxy-L-arabinose transferase-like glycosyltransferase